MSTYTFNDRLSEIKKPDPERLKKNDLEFGRFYETLKGLEHTAKLNGGKVFIIGDYDCDGICSSSILSKIFPEAEVILGDRYKYGYGVPTDIPVGKNDLIICTDVGTNDVDALSMFYKTYGAVTAIIDHHEFNIPKMKEYQYILNFNKEDTDKMPDYCATGLAYKLYEIDYRATRKEETDKTAKELNTVKALAAIGTIADMVKVNNPYDDNRQIILNGFEAIREADFDKDNFDETLGYVLSKCGITDNPYSITTDTIQMKVAPVFNAASRMKEGGAMEVFGAINAPFLTERGQIDQDNLQKIDEIFTLNDARKDRKKDALDSDEYKAVLNNDADIKIYVNDSLPLGLNGLIASDLTNRTGKPAIVFCKNPEGVYVGSGRNADGYPSALDEVRASGIDALRLGGHADAFGLSVAPDKMKDTIAALEKHYAKVKHSDVEIPHLDYIPKKGQSCPLSADDMMKLEPFGPDFPKVHVEVKGKVSDLDITISDIKKKDNPADYKKFSLGGITFTTFSAGEKLTDMAVNNEELSISGDLNINAFRDSKSFQVIFDSCSDNRERAKEKPVAKDASKKEPDPKEPVLKESAPKEPKQEEIDDFYK